MGRKGAFSVKEKWFIKNKKAAFDVIARTHHIHPILAQLIVNRGIHTNEEMEQYLNPSFHELHHPFLMKDLKKACEIIKEKIKNKEKIRIIGDYDVDGVMATYVLVTGLSNCGAIVDYKIPDRIKDGYGINIDIINQAILDGVDTILTCDNGIAAKEQVAFAKENGRTVIITDHHDIPLEGGNLEADAIVNPKQEDCTYPYKGICGAMVAYKLVEALYDECRVEQVKSHELFQYVAIATVCDVMDLKDENRVVVKQGIAQFEQTKNLGLQALKEECGLTGKSVNTYHFGFVIGPCINASGRLESAKLSLKLLLSKDKKEAEILAKRLKGLNDERKVMTEENLQEAMNQVETTSLRDDKVLVVYLKDCHESLAGIIAGRIKERYHRPTLVLTNTENGVKGSGRSIEEYHMFEELSKCRDILLKFGGHPMAAGFSLREDKVEELKRRLNETTTLTKEDFIPKVSFDMVLPLEDVNIPIVREMERLEPYGRGNEKPLFVLKNVEFVNGKILGANKNVLKCNLRTKESNGMYTGMIFQNLLAFSEVVDEKYGSGTFEDLMVNRKSFLMDIVFQLNINEYNGFESVQLIIQNYR